MNPPSKIPRENIEQDADRRIKIVCIANCGLLVESPQAKVLVDGIYQVEKTDKKSTGANILPAEELFSSISSVVLDRIIQGVGEFSDIDGLLFTHYHWDHFSAEKARQHLRNNPLASILLPYNEDPEMIAIQERAGKSGTKLMTMHLPIGRKGVHVIKDICIHYCRVPHTGIEWFHTPHYSFLLEIHGKKIYISGDADYTDGHQQEILAGEDITLGFFNALHFIFKAGRDTINRLHPKRVVMYHIPFEKDDLHGFRRVSQRVLDRYRHNLPPCEMVEHELQTFYL